MRKRWLLVGLIVGLLTLGIFGGAALAQSDDTSGSSPFKSFASRVAAILGIDEAQVQGAFQEAARDMQNEALQNKLDRMVENGKITREKADEIMTWFQSRPEGIGKGFPFGRFGHKFHRGFMGGVGCEKDAAPTTTPESSGTTSS